MANDGLRNYSAQDWQQMSEADKKTATDAYQKAPAYFYQQDKKGNYSVPNKMNASHLDGIAYGANLLTSHGAAPNVVDKYIATQMREQEQTMGVDGTTRDKNNKPIFNTHGVGHPFFRNAVESNYGVNLQNPEAYAEFPAASARTNDQAYLRVFGPQKEFSQGTSVGGRASFNKIGAQTGDANPYDPTMSPLRYLENGKLSSTMFSDAVSKDGQSANVRNWNPGATGFPALIDKAGNDLMNPANLDTRRYLAQKLTGVSRFKQGIPNQPQPAYNPIQNQDSDSGGIFNGLRNYMHTHLGY